ncbi:MAG: hypothetical protein ACI8RZ_000298 [Myxococcota bacterium]|jgi:hypothetical protein
MLTSSRRSPCDPPAGHQSPLPLDYPPSGPQPDTRYDSFMTRILPLMFALTACQKAPPDYTMSLRAASQTLEGVWKSDGGMITTIGGGEVLSLVDYDDEVFTVLTSGWEDEGFSMHYEVPSTQYLVTIQITEIDNISLQYAWNNTTPDGGTSTGTGYFERVE